MIPVALGRGEGADFRAPLGRAVIGGVITSTLLTLLVIPTVYEILDNFREWLGAKVWRRVSPGSSARLRPTGSVDGVSRLRHLGADLVELDRRSS